MKSPVAPLLLLIALSIGGFPGCCPEPLSPDVPDLAQTTMWVTDLSYSYDQVNPSKRGVSFFLSKTPDLSTINTETVFVEGMDGLSVESDSFRIKIEGITNNCTVVGNFPVCTLQVRLIGTGSAPIRDWQGYPLDGDHDRIQGGDYVYTIIF